MTQIDLSVSVVNYNTKDLLRDCLKAVFENTLFIQYEVFVVDNASRDGSVEMMRSEFPQVQLITNRENLGFAAANNQALSRAKGRYFLLLNSDTVVQKNALTKLVQFMDETPLCGVCCPQLIYPDGRLQKSYATFRTSKERARWEVRPRIREIESILENMRGRKGSAQRTSPLSKEHFPSIPTEVERPRGACFLARRKAIEQVGPMDERFFMYCEEVDWALRMRCAGWKHYFVPEACVMHIWGASTSLRSQLMDHISTQSDYKYHFKHFGLRGFLVVWSGHAAGACLSLLLGVYAMVFGWLGWNDFHAKKQFEVFRRLSKKLFLFRDIRPSE
jgi:GT2 family glycosyltransferase